MLRVMRSQSSTELQEHAAEFVRTLSPQLRATIVALSGELGAGKTTFAQGVARALGVTESVQSPTFILEKIYALENQAFKKIVHIDAYRLKSDEELRALGWDELLADSGNLILIEWPERVPGCVPEGAIRIRFDIEGDGRRITIDGQESTKEDR
jgi:tRNA threonylcarbamoyladenosine biosynthesis protein TsaE